MKQSDFVGGFEHWRRLLAEVEKEEQRKKPAPVREEQRRAPDSAVKIDPELRKKAREASACPI